MRDRDSARRYAAKQSAQSPAEDGDRDDRAGIGRDELVLQRVQLLVQRDAAWPLAASEQQPTMPQRSGQHQNRAANHESNHYARAEQP